MPGCAKSRISDMVNNGCVEPAPLANPTHPTPSEPVTLPPKPTNPEEPDKSEATATDAPRTDADRVPPTAGQAPAASDAPGAADAGRVAWAAGDVPDAGRAAQSGRDVPGAADAGRVPPAVGDAPGAAAVGTVAAAGSGAADEHGGAAAAPSRLARGEERSPRDMIMSLAVLIVPIALLLIFYRVVLSGDAPVTVDPSSTIQEAQRAAAFTVAVPQGLNGDWHVISATFNRQANGATLRLGYVDPDDDSVQLVESSVPPDALLPTELGDSAKALGNFRTPAGVWRVYDGRPGETAIVLADQTRTIVVVGRTDVKNLQDLATALR
jgi:uncharacterized protein DUF4245